MPEKKLKTDPLLDPIPLEELIRKRERFECEEEMLTGVLIFMASYVDGLINEAFKELEITRPQYNLLNILYNNHPAKMSMGLVSMRMVDKTSNVTRLADRLAERGIVQKTQNPDNRRVHELTLTPKGIKTYDKLRDLMRENVWAVLRDRLTPEEVSAAINILLKIKN
jgi:DNA-binding MarR family transcriptional regulator